MSIASAVAALVDAVEEEGADAEIVITVHVEGKAKKKAGDNRAAKRAFDAAKGRGE